ncbi:hypothetical protein OIU76_030634, partial [Salix suchowensis]
MSSSKVEAMQKLRLKHWKFLTNTAMSSSARIVVFWNPSTVMVDLVDCSSQGIHVVLRCLVSHISFQDDKLNESAVSAYEIVDFHKCHLDLGLCDLPYTGCHYTWSNGSIWSKIDRVLVNPFWSSLHQSAHVHFGNQGAFSDHSFATVRINPQDKGHRSFKFLNM